MNVRDGQVWNKAFHVAVGITAAAERDILGASAGDGAHQLLQ